MHNPPGKTPTSSVAIKEAMVFVCKALASIGIGFLAPEDFRQAKFNGPVTRKLWRAVHDLLLLHTLGVLDRPMGTALDAHWRRVALESTSAETLPPGAGLFVMSALTALEYPRLSHFIASAAQVASSASSSVHDALPSARESLVALGWLMATCRVFDASLQRRLALLWQETRLATKQAPLPPFPQDAAASDRALLAASTAEEEAEHLVARLEWSPLQPDVRANHLLLLHGRVRALASSLSALECCRARQLTRIHALFTALHGTGTPPTPYEIALALSSDRLARHGAALTAAEEAASLIRESVQYSIVFFKWMESVWQETGNVVVVDDKKKGEEVRVAAQASFVQAKRSVEQRVHEARGGSVSPLIGAEAMTRLAQAGSFSLRESHVLLSRLHAKLSGLVKRAVILPEARDVAPSCRDFYTAVVALHPVPPPHLGPTAPLASSLLGTLLPDDVRDCIVVNDLDEHHLVLGSLSRRPVDNEKDRLGKYLAPRRFIPKTRDKVQKAHDNLRGASPYAPPHEATAAAPSNKNRGSVRVELDRWTRVALEAARDLARVRAHHRTLLTQRAHDVCAASLQDVRFAGL